MPESRISTAGERSSPLHWRAFAQRVHSPLAAPVTVKA